MSHIRTRKRCVIYAYNCTHTKYSHLIKFQRKIDTVGLCRPDVATDQDLHGLSLVWSHVILNDEILK